MYITSKNYLEIYKIKVKLVSLCCRKAAHPQSQPSKQHPPKQQQPPKQQPPKPEPPKQLNITKGNNIVNNGYIEHREEILRQKLNVNRPVETPTIVTYSYKDFLSGLVKLRVKQRVKVKSIESTYEGIVTSVGEEDFTIKNGFFSTFILNFCFSF